MVKGILDKVRVININCILIQNINTNFSKFLIQSISYSSSPWFYQYTVYHQVRYCNCYPDFVPPYLQQSSHFDGWSGSLMAGNVIHILFSRFYEILFYVHEHEGPITSYQRFHYQTHFSLVATSPNYS